MGDLKSLRKEKIHTRGIEIATYAVDDDTIVVEGSLVDNRLVDYYYLSTGEKKKPGVIHHMIIRLLVGGPALTIREVEVEMPGIPREECRETENTLAPVAGMMIAGGFTAKVKSLVGGKKGCAHLVNLLLAMAPAAVQGFWVLKVRKPVSVDAFRNEEKLAQYLVNTCRVWREDGPLLEKLKKDIGIK